MKKYAIGIDFGTLSARAVLVLLENGKTVASSEFAYPHGVMDEELPDKTALGENYALQHPQDYIDAFCTTVKAVIEESGVRSDEISGVGIDFTSCTMLPVKSDGTPLCFDEKFKSEPYAYVKLWKHHAASAEADLITQKAQECGEKWLNIYGGKVSSEWLLPKILETYNKAPQLYNAAAKFVEAADWLVWLLTGENVCSSCMAGYKGTWNKKDGYPSQKFFNSLGAEFAESIKDKLSENILPTGSKAGIISKSGAALTGLSEGTAVAVPIIDAHASLPAAGIVDGGKLMLIIGTSTCHIIMSNDEKDVPGICGRVADGIVPGLSAYEAGQACVGDSFDWFVKNCVPGKYEKEAQEKGISIFTLLEEKAAALKVGESGLLALDWWNGNRTPYADYDLTGAIFGFTLQTNAAEIYRALIESTAFGTKRIVDLYENNGVSIEKIYASGGISQKNSLLMQIYADTLGREIIVPLEEQSGAFGSALFASVAGGYFESMEQAAQALIHSKVKVYKPDAENYKKYLLLYDEFCRLSEYFARENNVLKNLRKAKQ